MRRAHPPRIDLSRRRVIRASAQRAQKDPALPSPPREPTASGRSSSVAPSRLGSSIREPGAERDRSAPQCAGGSDEEDDVYGIGADCDDAADGGRIRRDEWIAESDDDRVRGRGIRRLPRRDRAPRVPARLTRFSAIRRSRKEVPTRRRPRLVASRRTDESFVNRKENLYGCSEDL